ncbi:MAG: hypothetical protein HC773_31845 [Scytonema sp. CRU_2_7]|nr:hypothetical protein [Scytonema sp. CRU_2_7]
MQSTEYINIDPQKYWLSLKRRWLAAVAVFGPVSALSVGMAFVQKPEYEAQGKILLKINHTPALTGVGEQLGELDRPLTDKGNPLNTEVEIIHSVPLVEKTITALNLKDEKGIPLKPQILIEKQLDVKNIGTTNVLQISYKSSDPKQAALVVDKLMSLYIERNVLTNRAEAVAAVASVDARAILGGVRNSLEDAARLGAGPARTRPDRVDLSRTDRGNADKIRAARSKTRSPRSG